MQVKDYINMMALYREIVKILDDRYRNPEQGFNLGPYRLSLLEFETCGIRPLSHHGQFESFLKIHKYFWGSLGITKYCTLTLIKQLCMFFAS